MVKNISKKVIAIVGPTASGKTGIGVRLAREFNGEIISADSRQVYRGLDIGTGKDLAELEGIKYHMIDIADPMEKMTLFDYLPLARTAIDDVLSRGKLPIIVGGTGLYVQALVEGFHLSQKSKVKSQKFGRDHLDTLSVEELNNILHKLDLEKHDKIDQKNKHRLIRAIELAQEGLRPIKIKPDFEVLQIGIDVSRDILHSRIDQRVDERFAQGMLAEVQGLLNKGIDPDWLLGLGLEYREMTNFLISNSKLLISNKNPNTKYQIPNIEFEQMKQQLKYRIHQFARRQMTWFRRFPEINWISDYDEIKRFVKIFLTH